MFTGIIKELGVVRTLKRGAGAFRLEIASKEVSGTVTTGDSVACNGVCLTVVAKIDGLVAFDVMDETIRSTNLEDLKSGDLVNLEDSLKVGSAIGGHFVLGHVDCAAKIKSVERKGADRAIVVHYPEEFSGLVVDKGSVAIDGVSLTVGEVDDDSFKVYLIPHTLKATTLGSKKAGGRVNLEFDVIGKYVLRHHRKSDKRSLTNEFLENKGFI